MSDKRTGKKTKRLAVAPVSEGETAIAVDAPSYVAVKAKKSHRK